MKTRIVLAVFMVVILTSGCSIENSNSVQNVPSINIENIAKETAIVKSNEEFPLDQLKIDDVEWITKKGGLPSEENWLALYPEKDSEKIVKIINLIKSCSDMNKSTTDDLDFMNTRHGYPVDIVIRMKDGSQFLLMSAMKLTTRKVNSGTETKGTTYKDHFLLAHKKGNSTEYYTIYSNDATAYILDSTNPDFPRVDIFAITPENIIYGDEILISGGGCTEKEVNIILSNGNDADTEEEYTIGKVKPVYGQWHWEDIISKNIKTYDGRAIHFKDKKCFIGIKVGERRYTSGIPIIFDESHISEDLDVAETIKPKVEDNLKSIEIINMNNKSNSKVNLKLPEGWYAAKYIYDIATEFEFNAEKNKQIKKTSIFEIYNGKDINKISINGPDGIFEMPGNYRDQPERTRFPNHSNVKTRVFSGKTILGQGEIFILECDLPDELRTENNTTYDMVYAWIPIENEKLAYNLSVNIPLGEKYDEYIQIVKKTLEAE